MKLGPFVSSGTAGVDARAIVTDYSVTEIGLTGRYYAGTNFETLALTRVENVDFDWGNDSPDQSVPSDYFSARWSGKLVPRYSETYTFYTVSNNGVRLWVNGQLLIDNWNSHRDTEDNGTITLVAGQSYDIKMEYYEQTFTATAQLLWSSPSQTKQIIPVEVLYPDQQ